MFFFKIIVVFGGLNEIGILWEKLMIKKKISKIIIWNGIFLIFKIKKLVNIYDEYCSIVIWL